MILERVLLYSLYNPYSIYFRMVVRFRVLAFGFRRATGSLFKLQAQNGIHLQASAMEGGLHTVHVLLLITGPSYGESCGPSDL